MTPRLVAGTMATLTALSVLAGCSDDEGATVTTTAATTAEPSGTSSPDTTFILPESPDCEGAATLAAESDAGASGLRIAQTSDGQFLCVIEEETTDAVRLEAGTTTTPEFVTSITTTAGQWLYVFQVPIDLPTDARVLAENGQDVASARTSDGRHLVVVEATPQLGAAAEGEVERTWTVVGSEEAILAELKGQGPPLR